METSAIVYKTVSRLPATRVEYGGLSCRDLNHGVGDSRVSVRSRNYNHCGRLNCQFSDSGHIRYYYSSPRSRCGGVGVAEKKQKEKSSEIKQVKKKLKFIKRLSKDLATLPQMADGEDVGIGLIGEVKEASDVLLAQLKQLRTEQKELKKNLKEKRGQLKATMEKSESSSSSSSESSDSERGEVLDMKSVRNSGLKPSHDIEALSNDALQQPEVMEVPIVETEVILAQSLLELENSDSSPQIRVRVPCSGFVRDSCSSNGFKDEQSSSLDEVTSTKKIEVCMGGKCKKLGAAALLEEFEKKVGAEGTVVACKCMGKCKTAPNVRVLNSPSATETKINEDSVRLAFNPTCTGVGLQDVDLIVSHLLGRDINDGSLVLSS